MWRELRGRRGRASEVSQATVVKGRVGWWGREIQAHHDEKIVFHKEDDGRIMT